jgi:hypothetical protein
MTAIRERLDPVTIRRTVDERKTKALGSVRG